MSATTMRSCPWVAWWRRVGRARFGGARRDRCVAAGKCAAARDMGVSISAIGGENVERQHGVDEGNDVGVDPPFDLGPAVGRRTYR